MAKKNVYTEENNNQQLLKSLQTYTQHNIVSTSQLIFLVLFGVYIKFNQKENFRIYLQF